MAEHRDREGQRVSAKEKICPSVTDKEQTAVTASPWDLGRADGNCCRTALPCQDQHCWALRKGSTPGPSPVPKATRGQQDAECGLVAPSHSFRLGDCPWGPTGLAARERQSKNSSFQHHSCLLKSRKIPTELLLGDREVPGRTDNGPAPKLTGKVTRTGWRGGDATEDGGTHVAQPSGGAQ